MRSAKLFSKMAAPFYIPITNVWRLLSFSISSLTLAVGCPYNACMYVYIYTYIYKPYLCVWRGISLKFWFAFLYKPALRIPGISASIQKSGILLRKHLWPLNQLELNPCPKGWQDNLLMCYITKSGLKKKVWHRFFFFFLFLF